MIFGIVEAKLALLRDEMSPRMVEAVHVLDGLVAEAERNGDVDKVERLRHKIRGVETVIDQEGERLANVQTMEDAVTISEFVLLRAQTEHQHVAEGIRLAHSYLLSHL